MCMTVPDYNTVPVYNVSHDGGTADPHLRYSPVWVLLYCDTAVLWNTMRVIILYCVLRRPSAAIAEV